MFKKILLPTDGSRHSEEAARIAAQIGACSQGVVDPLVAVEYRYVEEDELPEEISRAIRERIEARARRALERAQELVRQEGGRVGEPRMVVGPPADVILRVAEEGEYDLIVMGSRGVSRESSYQRLVGSVTERVLHAAPCPVLVIRAEAQP